MTHLLLPRKKTQMILTASDPATQAVIDRMRNDSTKNVWELMTFLQYGMRIGYNPVKEVCFAGGWIRKDFRVTVHGNSRSDLWIRKGYLLLLEKVDKNR